MAKAGFGAPVTLAANVAGRVIFPQLVPGDVLVGVQVLLGSAEVEFGANDGVEVQVSEFAVPPPDTLAGFAAGDSLIGLGENSSPPILPCRMDTIFHDTATGVHSGSLYVDATLPVQRVITQQRRFVGVQLKLSLADAKGSVWLHVRRLASG